MVKTDLKLKKLNTDKVEIWAQQVLDQWQMVDNDNLNSNLNLEHNFLLGWIHNSNNSTTSKNKIFNNKTIWCKIRLTNNNLIQGCSNQWFGTSNPRDKGEILWLRFLIIKIKIQWWWIISSKWAKLCKDNSLMLLRGRS